MAKELKYWGEFVSSENTRYRVELLTDDTSLVPQEVVFPYETAAEIEWNEVDKLEPVQGSCLTLSLSSQTDRQFMELFTIKVGTIRADIYRNNALYWSGNLDPELYEEPYSEKNDYDVTFTFSDFAILDRIKWEKKGICTIQEVIDTCIANMGIQYRNVHQFVSTSLPGENTPLNFAHLFVLGENFFDEDDEPMTMREVLDEVLRPFALRIIQKNGELFIYDLNSLFLSDRSDKVTWKDADATLDTSKVYNNVTVTFSPYADTLFIDGTLKAEEVLPATKGNLFLVDNDFNNAPDGFRLATGAQDGLPISLSNGAQFFRIDSEYSGSNEAGVVWAHKGWNKTFYRSTFVNSNFPIVFSHGQVLTKPILTTDTAFLGYASIKRERFRLRICLEVLFDVRYNPFEPASVPNEEGNWGRLQDWCNFGYIPVMLYLKDAHGNILYHFENRGVMESNSYEHGAASKWVKGEGKWGDMFLSYYDKGNRKSASGFGGWKKNRMSIGYYRAGLPKRWNVMEDGEFIDLPPVGGFLELQVGSGVHQFDYKREQKNIFALARWLLYKNPTVTLVKKNGTQLSPEDIEDSAWINKSANEELKIDTIIGTLGEECIPSARGLIFGENYEAYNEFSRAGTSGRLEHLLIGTIYSQYAQRHNTLSGTAELITAWGALRDGSSDGKFIILSEVQNLVQDISLVKMSEFVADCYDGIEYKENGKK